MAVVKKAKKKDIVSIISPKVFGEKEVGEVPKGETKNLIGKKATFNLVEVLPEYGKYYTKVTFRITNVDDGKAFTDFDSMELMRDYISRMVVRRVKRIDAIQDLTTKDGMKIRVKNLATVSRKASSKVSKAVRVQLLSMVSGAVKDKSFEEVLSDIFSDKMKRDFTRELRRIYPLRNLEFRKIEAR